jgi:hypothetical protein
VRPTQGNRCCRTSALVVVSVMHSAVDPGGGGASGAAFGTGKRLDGAEQKTTAHLLCWGARERLCWVCESAQLARLWWSL